MTILVRIGVFVAKGLLALVIAFVLIQIVAHLPTNMPDWLETTFRWVLRLIGRDDLVNSDGMEDVFELTFTVLALVMGVVVVWGGHGLIRRRSKRTL